MEPTTAYMVTLGTATLVVSWVLLLIVSWKEDFAWGLCSLFLPPLSYLYGLFRLDKTRDVMLAAVIGWALILLA